MSRLRSTCVQLATKKLELQSAGTSQVLLEVSSSTFFELTSSPTFLTHWITQPQLRALSHLDDHANTVKQASFLKYAPVRLSFENEACKRETDHKADVQISIAAMYGLCPFTQRCSSRPGQQKQQVAAPPGSSNKLT